MQDMHDFLSRRAISQRDLLPHDHKNMLGLRDGNVPALERLANGLLALHNKLPRGDLHVGLVHSHLFSELCAVWDWLLPGHERHTGLL